MVNVIRSGDILRVDLLPGDPGLKRTAIAGAKKYKFQKSIT